ncbi:MAG: UTP--glucose-1-phosphate uridylyltransferase [Victivallaceae bacterium]|nr:UTP--glucose-1-phosphate uridylyltransferase [Victivallaceae bacterium]
MRQDVMEALKKYHQEQTIHFFDSLPPEGKRNLENELAELDFAELDKLIAEYVLRKPETVIPADLTPPKYYPLKGDAKLEERYKQAVEHGKSLIAAGKVCCLTVAGGQGTRLGFDGPKGTYPIGPVSGNTLFAFFAGALKRMGEKYQVKLDWYIMTSLLNHKATVDFFEENHYFGLDKDQVFFFSQGTMPAIGYDGKLLLGSKDSLALSPNGHGGTLLALRKSGALDRMKQRGTEHISYFQVDNVLIPVINPLFVGLHDQDAAEMSAISLSKTGPFEKLGNFCVSDGRLMVIEYSDLPAELAEKRDASGALSFICGSPAIHVIRRDFVEHLTQGGNLRLPWHRADKKVPFVNADGVTVKPETPNAVKLESFIFDALVFAGKPMLLEGDRSEMFAPTKNPTGVDSVESARMMLMERDARRLEKAGVKVPRKADGSLDCMVEISPAAAVDDEDVAAYVKAHHLTALAPSTQSFFE